MWRSWPWTTLGELPSRFELPGRPVGQRPRVEVGLDLPASQGAADEPLGQGSFDVPLEGAPQRPRAVRPILAGDLDDPIDHLGHQRDPELSIDEILVQLVYQQPHD